MAYSIVILILTLQCMSAVTGLSLGNMYPYPHDGITGPDDQLMSRTLDGSSPVISFTFPFYDNVYNTIYVNNNGHLSFTGSYSVYIPLEFPISIPLVSLFWMDADTRTTGQVWYKLTNDSALLNRAKTDIVTLYDNQITFQPTKLFTATWLDVPYWQAVGSDATKRNTFQVVLVTDGVISFAMFHYQKIEWAGYADNATKAIVGFNAGDGVNSYTVNSSDYTDVINLEQKSNTGVPGKFIFRVDGYTIQPAGSTGKYTKYTG
ncbi:sushi, nidogen and EGF-like domain-containing protein 1 [Mizuhopecten yessoensis]|uniref:Sushi, nidogen and EGF-like domain-containing protein 1 n=1 Tax=Mizuhopecten yessoensis TaxID=6573 RepID=A0A210Q5T7_MIZYE|nr:sushi, nidogen and EGF-like domain-containing protein 1 [Mizuhopecten yessoensis]OWF44081.1 Sushi, nidogen and EGF-like domain-containing protein 1 [Mizuhopecten yessoensis]